MFNNLVYSSQHQECTHNLRHIVSIHVVRRCCLFSGRCEISLFFRLQLYIAVYHLKMKTFVEFECQKKEQKFHKMSRADDELTTIMPLPIQFVWDNRINFPYICPNLVSICTLNPLIVMWIFSLSLSGHFSHRKKDFLANGRQLKNKMK